jgi:hypothetical protein
LNSSLGLLLSLMLLNFLVREIFKHRGDCVAVSSLERMVCVDVERHSRSIKSRSQTLISHGGMPLVERLNLFHSATRHCALNP